jgi:hypothetical protein
MTKRQCVFAFTANVNGYDTWLAFRPFEWKKGGWGIWGHAWRGELGPFTLTFTKNWNEW